MTEVASPDPLRPIAVTDDREGMSYLDKLPRRVGDGLDAGVVRRLLAGRPRERERLEGGRGRVAEAAFRLTELRSHSTRP